MITRLSILGFRGFGEEQEISFAIPDGEKRGSGLTIITGANNSGKTTIIESIRAFNSSTTPSFSEGRRNTATDRRVHLKLIEDDNSVNEIKTVRNGGSTTEKTGSGNFKSYILQSRRGFPFEFGKMEWSRDAYIQNAQALDGQRKHNLESFSARIFQIEREKEAFDVVLREILGKDFNWVLEQRDNGNYYIKYIKDGIEHSSEGVGDGVWSIFTICAALFDAKENSVIVIDEPELSVHPALQKKMMSLLMGYAQTRQIVLCTHSPYFVNWESIVNGANLIRVVKEGVHTKCYEITDECRKKFEGILRDLNNPHTLGIEANEAFFLEDGIILVEGQEDVVIFNKIAQCLGVSIDGNFFGWGVGGATKMEAFLMLFRDLGYKKVLAILDGDKKEDAQRLVSEFKNDGYKVIDLLTDDIRDKEERTITAKTGITDTRGMLKNQYSEYARQLVGDINSYFS